MSELSKQRIKAAIAIKMPLEFTEDGEAIVGDDDMASICAYIGALEHALAVARAHISGETPLENKEEFLASTDLDIDFYT